MRQEQPLQAFKIRLGVLHRHPMICCHFWGNNSLFSRNHHMVGDTELSSLQGRRSLRKPMVKQGRLVRLMHLAR